MSMSENNDELIIEGVIETDHVIVTEEIGQEIDRGTAPEIAAIEIESLVVNDHVKKKGTKTLELKGKRALL